VNADFISSIVVIFLSFSAFRVPCAEDSSIWLYSLVSLILAPAFVISLAFILQDRKSAAICLFLAPSLIMLFMAVWGVVLWADLPSECDHYYSETYWALFLVFKINVVLLAIALVISLIAVSARLVDFCDAAATLISGNVLSGGYDNIP
jgi:cytochrome b subunit of formate dehydrogenase